MKLRKLLKNKFKNMTNLFIVVDENDTIIWYKSKEDIDPIKEYYRVSWLRLTNSKGQILIAQRAFTKKNDPGKRWPAVAGTIEKGESYEDNIIKEIEEELWLTGISVTLWPKTEKEEVEKYHYFWQWFFATVNKNISEFRIQKEEVAAIKWISPEELKKDIRIHPERYLRNMKEHLEKF
jgi:isopentenyl-diphosphate delta-isomerase